MGYLNQYSFIFGKKYGKPLIARYMPVQYALNRAGRQIKSAGDSAAGSARMATVRTAVMLTSQLGRGYSPGKYILGN